MRFGLILALFLSGGLGVVAQETVTVYRDAIGLPHVYADSDEAVAYGLGRLHFRDRPLRTVYNLTRASGRLLETAGQFNPEAARENDLHYIEDHRALRYHRVERARTLLDHYQRTGAPPEDRALVRLLHAFVKGLNDERKARPAGLASYFVGYRNDLPGELRLTAEQIDALLARNIEAWEPLALMTMVMRSIWEGLVDQTGQTTVDRQTTLLPGGSNSWTVPSGGSESGHTFVYADSHQPAAWYIAARFQARQGVLDGGGWTVSGLPFLLCGFGRNVGWAITLSISDPVDFYSFDGDVTSSPGFFVDHLGRNQPLVARTWPLLYRQKPGDPLTTLTVVDRYLDVEQDMPVTAVTAGGHGHPHLLHTARFSYHGNPVPSTALDPGCDPFRMFYRMLTAADADHALNHAISDTLSFTGLNVTVGDAVRAITVPAERLPHRRHEIPFESGWHSYWHRQHMSHHDDMWVHKDGHLYHPITDFPIARSDGRTPVRDGKALRFWASCNCTPIWLLGLEFRFGQSESALPFDTGHQDYVNPFEPADYVRRPSTLTFINNLGAPWGNHTLRQEWITTGLKVAWELGKMTQPHGISEGIQVAMMADQHDPLAIYLEERGFFTDLVNLTPAGPLQTLATRLRTWARDRLAPHTLTPPRDAADAACFLVFWSFFQHELQGPWSRAWKRPFAWDFFVPREEKKVKDAALQSLALTHGVFTRYPDLDLGRLKRFAIPFGGPEVPLGSTKSAGHVTFNTWAVPPWESSQPRIHGGDGGRMPMLMRLRKIGETHHRIQLMTPAHPGRVKTLPEWTAVRGPGFHEAPLRWARAEIYDMPMTEDALKALGHDPQVTRTFTYTH
jgi:penicillin amidase